MRTYRRSLDSSPVWQGRVGRSEAFTAEDDNIMVRSHFDWCRTSKCDTRASAMEKGCSGSGVQAAATSLHRKAEQAQPLHISPDGVLRSARRHARAEPHLQCCYDHIMAKVEQAALKCGGGKSGNNNAYVIPSLQLQSNYPGIPVIITSRPRHILISRPLGAPS
jgi:hypothetical protein